MCKYWSLFLHRQVPRISKQKRKKKASSLATPRRWDAPIDSMTWLLQKVEALSQPSFERISNATVVLYAEDTNLSLDCTVSLDRKWARKSSECQYTKGKAPNMLLLLHAFSSSVAHLQNGNIRKLARHRVDDLVCSILP